MTRRCRRAAATSVITVILAAAIPAAWAIGALRHAWRWARWRAVLRVPRRTRPVTAEQCPLTEQEQREFTAITGSTR